MRILFAAAEAAPFIKTGGLGDVIGSLPKELKNLGLDVRVILPKYKNIPEIYKQSTTLIKRFSIPMGTTNQFCGVELIEINALKIYFIDNEIYFNRSDLYGYCDDGERFGFFCKAVLECLIYLDFQPDVIHCHDWHTAMISVLLKTQYRYHPFYKNIKSIFTIHNLQYQGIFSKDILSLLGLKNDLFTIDGLEFYNQVNFIKGGIAFSDLITTVSKTYASEIQTPQYGEKLEGLLLKRKSFLFGIVNGIDYEVFNPKTDCHIFQHYNEMTLRIKGVNKTRLQKHLSLKESGMPLIAIVSRLVKQKGLDLVEEILDELLEEEVQLVVLGTGEEKYENLFKLVVKKYPSKISANILFDTKLANRIYAGSDFFLMPSLFEPCGLGQLIALRYGTIPIVRNTGGLKDTIRSFNEISGKGNGFTFDKYSGSDLLFTIKKAMHIFNNKPVFENMIKQAMLEDFSWNRSALDYNKLYENLSA
ncbi:MAG: glycogen synthase [Desulfitibacter sp. BRH_c19]|nr:MAG: glycogen synthase [Desulfitibacter sp. BRH_c19]